MTSSTQFTLTTSDNPFNHNSSIAFTWYTDNGVYNVYSGAFTLSGEGEHNITWGSEDNLGNNETGNSIKIWVDDSTPTTNLYVSTPKYRTNPLNDWNITSSTTITLQASDNPIGHNATVDLMWYTDNGVYNIYTAPFTLTSQGQHNLTWGSEDYLGNNETGNSMAIWVDDSTPTTTMLIGTPKYRANPAHDWNVTSSTSFTLSGSDNPARNSGVSFSWYFDNGVYHNYSTPFTLNGEGQHDLTWGSEDYLGNNETGNTIAVWVDDSTPTTSIPIGTPKYRANPAHDWNITSSTTFTLSSSDNPVHNSGVSFNWYSDNGVYYVYSVPFTLNGEGQHNLIWGSEDYLGNNETGNSMTVWLDDTAPTTTMPIGTPKYRANPAHDWNVTSATTFILTGSDNPAHNSGVYFRWYIDNGVYYNYSAPFTLSGEGKHDLTWGSEDYLGNNETGNTITVWVDDSTPTTQLTIGDPKYRSNPTHEWNVTSMTQLTLSTNDNPMHNTSVAITWYKIDGDYYTGISFNLSSYGDGLHTINWGSSDNLNNNESGNSIIIWLDDTSPTILSPSIIENSDFLYSEGTNLFYSNLMGGSPENFMIWGNAVDSGSGLKNATFSYAFGDSPASDISPFNWSASYDIVFTDNGNGLIYVNITDNLGNLQTQIYQYYEDLSAPSNVTPVDEGIWSTSNSITWNWPASIDITSGVAGYYISIGSIPGGSDIASDVWVTTTSYTYSTATDGITYYAKVKAKDNVGNLGPYGNNSDGITIDTTAPDSLNLLIDKGASYTNSLLVDLNLTASDSNSGVNSMQFSNDGTTWSSWESYSISKTNWDLSAFGGTSTSGLKSVYFRVNDTAGNIANIVFDTIYLDQNNPTSLSILIDNDATFTNSMSVTLSLTASDIDSGVAQMQFSNDGNAWSTWESYTPVKTNWDLSSYGGTSNDGLKTVYFRVQDQAGNIANYVTDTIELDTTKPTTTITINNGALLTNSTIVTLTLTAGDGSGSGVNQMSFDSGTGWTAWESYAPTKQITLPSGEGLKTVYFRVIDNAGNINDTESDTITLDSTAPSSLFITINSGATYSNSLLTTLSLTASDSNSGVNSMQCSNDGTTWSSWESYSTTKLNWDLSSYGGSSSDGMKTVYFRVNDNAGNVANMVTDTIYLDRTNPTSLSILIDGDSTYTNSLLVTLSLSAFDSGSGLSQMQFSNDGTTWSSWEGYSTTKLNWNLSLFGGTSNDGLKTVYFRVNDNAGNTANYVTDTINLDRTIPIASITINSGATFTNSLTVTLTLSANDGTGSGIKQMSFDTGTGWTAWELYSSSKQLNLPTGDSLKTVYFKVKDNAGNIANVVSDTIILDTTAPNSLFISINSGTTYTNSIPVTLSLSASDSNSGLDSMKFSNDGTIWSSWESYSISKSSWDLSSYGGSSSDGTKIVYFKVRDNADNIASVVIDTIILDRTKPNELSILINNNSTYSNSLIVTMSLSAYDIGSGLSQMQFSNDGTTWSPWESYSSVKLNWNLGTFGGISSDGVKTVSYRVKDTIGNIANYVIDTIFLDRTEPTATININNGANYTNSITITLTLTANDNSGSGLNQMSFDTGTGWTAWETYSTQKLLSLPSVDGVKTVYCRVIDKAGNIAKQVYDNISLDISPPNSLSILINNGDEYTNSEIITLTLNAFDFGSGVGQMALGDGSSWSPWEAFGSSKSFTLLTGDGTKTIYLKVRDKMGNEASAVYNSIILDQSPPTSLSILINDDEPYTNRNKVVLSLNADDYGSGISEMAISSDGINWNWQPFLPSVNYNLKSGDGMKNVHFKVKDNAGNIANVVTDSITLDTTPPSDLLITINNGAKFSRITSIELTLKAIDAGSGLWQMAFDNGNGWTSWELYSGLKNLSIPSGDGLKNINYKVMDKAGNSASASNSIILDTTPPRSLLILLNNGDEYTNSINIELTLDAIDTESGVGKMAFNSGSGWTDWVNFERSYTISIPSKDGQKTVFYKVLDLAGNEASVVYDSIILDTIPPDIYISYSDLTEDTIGDFRINLTVVDSGSGNDIPFLDYRIGDNEYSGFDKMIYIDGINWYYIIYEPEDRWDAHRNKHIKFKIKYNDMVGNERISDEYEELIEPINDEPTAIIGSIEKKVLRIGEEVELTAENSYDTDGNIETYSWNCIETEEIFSDKFSHKFDKIGTYEIKLTVFDNEGAESSDHINITIEDEKDYKKLYDDANKDIDFYIIVILICILLIILIIIVPLSLIYIFKKRERKTRELLEND